MVSLMWGILFLIFGTGVYILVIQMWARENSEKKKRGISHDWIFGIFIIGGVSIVTGFFLIFRAIKLLMI